MFDNTTIARDQPRIVLGRPRNRAGTHALRRAAAIAAVGFVEAILILGFVVASLGLGFEGRHGVGPDHPPAPAPRPPIGAPEPEPTDG
jgi:hypothetical protein